MTTSSIASPDVDAEHEQNKTPVSFLGPFCTYSHQATLLAFPDTSKWVLEPTSTIKEVFDRVQSGAAPYGVVPFENSTHGVVTFTLDGLADRAGEYPDICVCGEIYLDVHHFLLGRRPPSSSPESEQRSSGRGGEENPKGVPLASLSHIRRVYSHPQAFGQTARFQAKYLQPLGIEFIDVSSTSRAAQLAAADPKGESAAIASELAGREAGLDVLARWVEDREDNTTRFFVIRRKETTEGGYPPPEEEGKRYKSLVSFTVPHRQPGALANVLDCFRRRELNLTSINSLPSLVAPFQYLFFVEFEGGREDDHEGRISGVLEDLEKVAERWRWLGSWRRKR